VTNTRTLTSLVGNSRKGAQEAETEVALISRFRAALNAEERSGQGLALLGGSVANAFRLADEHAGALIVEMRRQFDTPRERALVATAARQWDQLFAPLRPLIAGSGTPMAAPAGLGDILALHERVAEGGYIVLATLAQLEASVLEELRLQIDRGEQAERQQTRVLYAAIALSVAATIYLARRLRRRVLEPISKLRQAAGRLGSGQLDQRVEVAGDDEFSQLASAFNAMAEALASNQRELMVQHRRTAAVIETARHAFVSMDESGGVTEWNRQAEECFGWSRDEACGREVADLIIPARLRDAHREGFRRFLGHGEGPNLSRVLETTAMARGGREFPVEITAWYLEEGGVLSFNAFIQDTSERHRLAAELRQAQKLESMGQLASGIAHEINTPIQFIGDNVRFLGDAFGELALALDGNGRAETAPAPDLAFLMVEVPLAVEQTLEGVERVATIVKAMKAIGHPSTEHKTYADLNQAIRNTLVVAVSEIKYVADVDTELGDLPPVWCHPGDVNQVLLNLVVNAAHAIREKVGGNGERGTITVRTFPEGDDAIIEVTDTGAGITPEVGEHIFEPFFTTKEVGVGTGQGLALVYSLVTDRHRGSIGFVSEPGAGTTFTVRLPMAAPALAATP
jgi:PAS domain S-box-containing protein